jgi:2,4-dienoyl-CoA reductase-like NADH-dependent reductase (Old Yellow Enzyme family)
MPSTTLLSPFSRRSVKFDNRIVVSPMGQFSAAADGLATEWHTMRLGHLAVSGAGLVFTEARALESRGRVSSRCLGTCSDEEVYFPPQYEPAHPSMRAGDFLKPFRELQVVGS